MMFMVVLCVCSSALCIPKAQIKKRTGGDRTGEVQATEEVKTQNVKDSPNEEFPPSSSQLSRSPRSASHLAGAALVLPPLGGSSGG